MSNRTWTLCRQAGHVPSPRYFHAAVVHGESLFLFGGYSGQERLNDLYEYRLDIHTWFCIQSEDPPTGRSSLVAAVQGNSLFVFGGYNGSVVLNDFYELRFEPVSIPASTLLLRTRWTTESNSVVQRNLIGYLIASLKPNRRGEKESKIHIFSC